MISEEHAQGLLCRLDRRLRRFPVGASCAACGCRNPLYLVWCPPVFFCRECNLVRQGRASTEVHHLGGKDSPHTEVVPANLHALLTFLQLLWRYVFEPCSPQAYLLDLLLLRVLGPSFGWEPH